jgi:chromosome segregation ATPase
MNIMFGAIIRFFRTIFKRKGQAIDRANDAQYTGSAQGIQDGYDQHNDTLVQRYKDLRGAITTFETALETKKARATDIGLKIVAKEKALNGALSVIEKATTAGDTAKAAEAKKDAIEFNAALKSMHDDLDTLEAGLKEAEGRRSELFKSLGDLKKEIDNLPQEKADAIADFISNKQMIETLDRIGGLQTSTERSPVDAIRAKNKELAAAARVAQNVTHAANTDREKLYTEEGAATSGEDDITAMLARRAADKAKTAEKTGETPVVTQDREKI